MTFNRAHFLRKAEAFIDSRRVTTATKRSPAQARHVEVDMTPPKLSPAPDIGNGHWIVAMTSPRSDARAIAALQEAGYAVFSPGISPAAPESSPSTLLISTAFCPPSIHLE